MSSCCSSRVLFITLIETFEKQSQEEKIYFSFCISCIPEPIYCASVTKSCWQTVFYKTSLRSFVLETISPRRVCQKAFQGEKNKLGGALQRHPLRGPAKLFGRILDIEDSGAKKCAVLFVSSAPSSQLFIRCKAPQTNRWRKLSLLKFWLHSEASFDGLR